MVAKIITGKSIRGALLYNENKVAKGKAQLILANGFATDIEKMTFNQKLRRFEYLLMLNPRVKTNTLHISLNFDASEKLDNARMQQISMAYMEKIGFGDQPYLAYRHHDAAHQHIHLITTNLKRDGKRIDLHNIGRLISEPARKEIEKEFGLVIAERKNLKQQAGIKAINAEKIQYGHIPTKRAISNVVNAVVEHYKFTSLAELNAVLKCFNVVADRGNEDSEMFKKKGLVFSLLDKNGNKVGVPIKSSSLYFKPTLPNLEKKFIPNQEMRKVYKDVLRMKIDQVFLTYRSITGSTLVNKLKEKDVDVIFRQNAGGLVYGVTFIDHKTKSVFNGSDLGKTYSAKAVSERLSASDQRYKQDTSELHNATNRTHLEKEESSSAFLSPGNQTNYLELVLARNNQDSSTGIPKKKKRKKLNHNHELTL